MPLLGSELVRASISPLNRLDTTDLKPRDGSDGVLRWIQAKTLQLLAITRLDARPDVTGVRYSFDLGGSLAVTRKTLPLDIRANLTGK